MEMYDNSNLLPPGFRFYPTEEELVDFYLRNKLNGKRELDIQRVIPVVNIYQHNPCQLPGYCIIIILSSLTHTHTIYYI